MGLKRFLAHRKLAQSTIEYAVLIGVFAAAVLLMFGYMKAGIKGKFKFLGDEMWFGMTEKMPSCGWSTFTTFRCYKGNSSTTLRIACPEGKYMAGLRVIKNRIDNGDRDCYNFGIFCCDYKLIKY
ncbi:MAG: hypothetical protein V1674_06555 [Candidatus Omnitrophota bacterium]